jgi:hypothetical protein
VRFGECNGPAFAAFASASKPSTSLRKELAMNRIALASLFVLIALVGTIRADDKEKKADPTGTWKWTVTFNDQTRDQTVKLKADGEKLTGTMMGRNNQETPIEEGTFKNGEVSFKVTRERNGQKFTTKYMGKVDGDTIKGKQEFDRDGKSQSRDWEAKREKEKA